MRTSFKLFYLLSFLTACNGQVPAPGERSTTQTKPLVFTNGGFETGDTTGWTITWNKNAGLAASPPTKASDLALVAGGAALTAAKTGATQSVVPFGLLATDTLRYPQYGQWAVEVNSKSSSLYGYGQNANTLTQQMTTSTADVDTDGKIHIRFVIAPVMQKPLLGHTDKQQPYYWLEVKNVTKGTTLATQYHAANDTTLPWKTSASLAQYTDWQTVDIAPGNVALAVGDIVQVTAIAAGCPAGDHFSVLYLDGFGTSLPGLSVVATAPSSVNTGNTITYDYLVKNGGGTTASNVIVTNNLPPTTTFQSVVANGATCTTPLLGLLGPVTCNVGTLNPAQTATFRVTVQTTATGTVTNSDYNVAAPGVTAVVGTPVTTQVTAGVHYADLSITNTDNTAAVLPGAALTYTVVATNAGPTAVTNAIITDTFSSQLTSVTWTCIGLTGTCGAALGTGNLDTTTTLPSGGSVTYTVVGTVATSATGSLVSTASIAAPSGITDSVLGNNAALDTDGIGMLRLVSVTKTGLGTGTVTSSPAAIDCGALCLTTTSSFVDGSNVTLTAVASSGSTFAGWTGACSSKSPCTLSLHSDAVVGVGFALQTFVVAASVPGGNGTVSCQSNITIGSPATCTASAAPGYSLVSLADNGSDVTGQVRLGLYGLSNVSLDHTLIAVFKANLGMQCATAADCGSGQCVDGVCCNSACNGQCQACDVPSLVGVCSPVVGAPHNARSSCGGDTACGGICDGITTSACAFPTTICSAPGCSTNTASAAAFCDGAGHCPAPQATSCGAYGCGALTCNSGCSGANACTGNNFCLAGVCVPKAAQGGICLSDDACGTGHCVDGLCCDTACTGQCAACNLPGKLGTCSATTGSPVGSRPACASDGLCGGRCDGTTQNACSFRVDACISASCSGGIEVGASPCDGAGHCNVPAETSCGAFACGSNVCKATCTTSSDCASNAFCALGLCVPKASQGALCTDASQCGSGHCSGGVCCDTTCDGSCSACNLPLHVGTCTSLPAATSCTTPSCALDVAVSASTCNGAGSCIAGVLLACPFGCDGDTCKLAPPLPDLGGVLTLPDLGGILTLPDLGGVLPHGDMAVPLPSLDLALPAPQDLGGITVGLDLSIIVVIGANDMAHPTEPVDMAHSAQPGDMTHTIEPTDMAHSITEPGDMATVATPQGDMAQNPFELRGGGCDVGGPSRSNALGAALLVLAALYLARRRVTART